MSWITRARYRLPGLAWAAAADIAWHLAGPAWAVTVLILALGWIAGQLPAAMAASAKAYGTEDRLNALVPKIPSPKTAPAGHSDTTSSPGNTSYNVSNSSYGMSGGTNVTYNTGSGNNGGSSSQTSGQIGGASAHYHDMTHYHTSSSDLQSVFNALRDSHSNLVPAVNTLRDSHSSLVSNVQQVQASHATLSDKHNGLIDTIKTTKLLT